MEKGFYRLFKAAVLTVASVVAISFTSATEPTAVAAVEKPAAQTNGQIDWQDFSSTKNKCSMQFPKYPDHLSEKLRLPEEGFDLKYDAYVSAIDQKTVYLLLVAEYPDFVDESYARMSLEGFLSGILTRNPNNQLIFADLSLVEGHEALDFFIRTGGVYFKGRALMVKNSLYLMAMECEVQNYDEASFNTFVNSFRLNH